MSDYFSGHRYHPPPWLGHLCDRNVISDTPFAFNSYSYYFHLSDVFTKNSGGRHLFHHRHQSASSFARLTPTSNLRIGACSHGGAKAYFRFHGGIGDGCCGIAFRNIVGYTAARPLQLFDALDPIDFQMNAEYEGGFGNIPMIGPSFLPVEASSGTGVFIPVYRKRIRARRGDDVNNNAGMHVGGGGRMKQEDAVAKAYVGGDVARKKKKDMEEIPIEMLLPSEWPY